VPQKDKLPLQTVTLRLYLGDFEKMQGFYPTAKANKAIRMLVHRHVRRMEERLAQQETINDERLTDRELAAELDAAR
jgi:hypothetical protein